MRFRLFSSGDETHPSSPTFNLDFIMKLQTKLK